jgi:xanthine dehydrogenase accessory factor
MDLHPELPSSTLARAALAALEGGAPCATAVVIGTPPGAEEILGARLLVREDAHEGVIPHPGVAEAARAAAEAALAGRAPQTVEVEAPEGSFRLFAEAFHPPPALVIVGAGHIARPLCRVGAGLGFRVSVLDDRPAFATEERFPEADRVLRVDFSDPFAGMRIDGGSYIVLVTRGHKYDYEALRDVLRREGPQPAYIGMVGSRRRVRATFEQLAREGVAAARIAAVRSPIGLDIEAETPEEIAISIAAELVQVRRGGSGRPLREVERVHERWIARMQVAQEGAPGASSRAGTSDQEST